MNRREFACGAIALLVSIDLGNGVAFATSINMVAVDGYDVVAYFDEKTARKGSPELAAEHRGATYYFVSAVNRAAFVADPEKYLPQFGGNCAWAASNGYKAEGDPEAWSIVDGKLYLNYSKGVRSKWEKDATANISRADANWPGLSQ